MGVAWLLHDAADDDLKEHRLVVGQDCEPDCHGQGGVSTTMRRQSSLTIS